MQLNEKAAEIINDLIKINNDRIEGYQRAILDSKDEDSDLIATFESMRRESETLKQELSGIARQLGEEPETGTRIDGKIYRAWMAVSATFSGNTRKSVLENCEYGEDAAQKAYKEALYSNDLPEDLRLIVSNQQQELRQAHDRIRSLRNTEEG